MTSTILERHTAPLERHYQNASAARERACALGTDEYHAAADAADCAALHVAIDCMQRIAQRRTVAPDTRHYEPIARRTALAVTAPLVALLSRHAQRVHDARTFLGDARASLQATTTALISVLR